MNRNSFIFVWVFSEMVVNSMLVYLFMNLPEHFATHFDFSGNPNGWMTKLQFILIFALTFTFAQTLTLAIALILDRLPKEFINIPRKDYWFSTPALQAEALGIVRKVLMLTVVFVSGVFVFTGFFILQAAGGLVLIQIPKDQLLYYILAAVGTFLILIWRTIAQLNKPTSI